MSSTINFHPEQALLKQFAAGELTAGLSVAVSAHLQNCASCRASSQNYESAAAEDWAASADTASADLKLAVDDLLKTITATPQVKEAPASESKEQEVEILLDSQAHTLRLPSVLAKLVDEGLQWQNIAGGISEATVALDDKTQCEFLYMKPGSQVPVHKHQGTEVTLVLDGSFSDADGEYHPADFLVRSGSETHQPKTDTGCLCFAVLDAPLTFTSGLARFLNPLLRYRFRRVTNIGL